ncbi:hypothetical protein NPX13_g2685 [Xylaria arbuscula]|uniref:DUF202 domain-containing protein n=1 Tax=Xylaria arbuscula TaxID=114810 RepID=A0A9W8NJQ9_9PEZI|nr:hypothetical protein NPX13_g2685 [Xylaria arbuscula]
MVFLMKYTPIGPLQDSSSALPSYDWFLVRPPVESVLSAGGHQNPGRARTAPALSQGITPSRAVYCNLTFTNTSFNSTGLRPSNHRLLAILANEYRKHNKALPNAQHRRRDGLVEIRAAQRTFEGAYMRTALGQFSFALIILKIFTAEFYAIGALFAAYGATVMVCAMYRRYEGNRQFFNIMDHEGKVTSKFRTCNNSVLLLTTLSLGAYIGLLVLTWNLAA